MSTAGALYSYAYLIGAVQLVVAAVWLLCATGLIATRGVIWFGRHTRRVAIFSLVFFVWGLCAYTACRHATWGRLYVSHDELLDWNPVIPFGEWAVHSCFGEACGQLLAPSMLSLRAIWGAATLVVWVGAVFSFRFFTRASRNSPA